MSNIKFKIVPDPTFKAQAAIPIPGADPEKVGFTYKHRSRREFKAYMEDMAKDDGKDDIDLVMDTVTGWELTDEFTRENVEKLLDNYHGAARAIVDTYIDEQGALRSTALGK